MKINKHLADLAASEGYTDEQVVHTAQEDNNSGGDSGGFLETIFPGEDQRKQNRQAVSSAVSNAGEAMGETASDVGEGVRNFFLGDPEAENVYNQRVKANQMKHVAGIAGTAVALPFLARAIMSRNTQKEQERRNEMLQRAAVARNPIVELDSPSLDVAQAEQEPKKEESDNQTLKRLPNDQSFRLTSTAQEDEGLSIWEPAKETIKAPIELIHKGLGFGQKGVSGTYPLLALGILGGGTYLGGKWADKAADKERSEELDQKLQKAKQKLDRAQFKALAEQRGLPYPEEEEQQEKQASEDINKTAGIGAGAIHTLAILGGALGTGGYFGGKHLAKTTAPDKVKAYKELKDSLRHQIQDSDQPELYLSSDSDMRKLFGPTTEKERKKRQEELPATGLSID